MRSGITGVPFAAALAFCVCAVLASQDSTADLQARFDRESDAVRKAKLFTKLGDKQFEETRSASRASNYQLVGFTMEKYRDNARIVLQGLKETHSDAYRHTGGYKQLQMHVHRALHELDELLVVTPSEYKPPLELVRRDLVTFDEELLELLFPPRPERKRTAERSSLHPEKQP